MVFAITLFLHLFDLQVRIVLHHRNSVILFLFTGFGFAFRFNLLNLLACSSLDFDLIVLFFLDRNRVLEWSLIGPFVIRQLDSDKREMVKSGWGSWL